MKWALATVCYENVKPWYVMSLWRSFVLECPVKAMPEYITVNHAYLVNARNQAANVAKEMKVDGILWIDSDMEWKPEDVAKVLTHSLLGVIFGALYPGRKEPIVGGIYYDSYGSQKTLRKELVEADYLGFGFLWTPIKCFDGPGPWFNSPAENGEVIGEDVYFCREQRKRGIKTFALTSLRIGHAYEPGVRYL